MSNPSPMRGSGARLLLIIATVFILGVVVGVNYIAPQC